MEEVVFEIDHQRCSFNNITLKFPDLKMWHWCSRRVDVFEVTGRDSKHALDDIVTLAKSVGGSVEIDSSAERGRAILSEPNLCPCNRIGRRTRTMSITSLVEEHRCMHLDPITYSGGRERRRMVSFDPDILSSLLSKLEDKNEFTILSKRRIDSKSMKDYFTIPLSDLFSQLTGRQYSALSDALTGGYYDVPRTVSVEKLSKRRRVPRSTFEEHLHKGEGKVMKAITPFLLLYNRNL